MRNPMSPLQSSPRSKQVLKPHIVNCRRAVVIVALVCTALSSPETAESQPEVGTVVQHISGTVDFEGCDASARNNINDAMALILDRLDEDSN